MSSIDPTAIAIPKTSRKASFSPNRTTPIVTRAINVKSAELKP